MQGSLGDDKLPPFDSPDLILSHPTAEERVVISTGTAEAWRDALPLPAYLEESDFLATAPLAKNNGLTSWILVNKHLQPNQRPILSSCETYRKRALLSNSEGNIEDVLVHGVASVFCLREYRGRGYAARMMNELAKCLYKWQSGYGRCAGSILYSDIGKRYYASLGWQPRPTNSHVTFQPSSGSRLLIAKEVPDCDLAPLCERDEAMIRKSLAARVQGAKPSIMIVPDVDHMLWHIAKEEFACNFLFSGKKPLAKGAIAGPPGSQVWAIWTHRYYGPPAETAGKNVLYILRLVIEGQETSESYDESAASKLEEQTKYLQAVIQAAQAEAVDWQLDEVKLWDPSPLVREMISRSKIDCEFAEREDEAIASGMWYDEHGNPGPGPVWLNNEHYAWC